MKKIIFLIFAAVPFLAFAQNKLSFENACAPGEHFTVGAVGDILPHQPLHKQSMASPQGFVSLWGDIAALLRLPNVMYGNLEGPVSPAHALSSIQYSFNYSTKLTDDLARSGFQVVSTANNHAMDRGALGVDQTINSLNKSGLLFTGTRKQGDLSSPWYAITKSNGLKLAWIACTYGTNGIPDIRKQVLKCFEDSSEIVSLIQLLKSSQRADAVIVTPHWGNENEQSPNSQQRQYARIFLNGGATAVIGSHPHVLQTWEKIKIGDEERLVVYSLGNFISNQFMSLPQMSTIMLYIGLTKTASGKVIINGVRHVPLLMTKYPYALKAIDRLPAGTYASQSLAHIRSKFQSGNELKSSAEILVTNPECP